MKYHEMTKNYIFREFECGLTVEEAAKLCLKTVRTVKERSKNGIRGNPFRQSVNA